MPPVFYDPDQAVKGLFAPPPRPFSPPALPPGQPPGQSQWWQQPRSEQEIAQQDLVEHGNQPLGVGRLEQSDPNIDMGMNRLRPATEQRTGDTFMGVNPEEGEMQGDPSLRENIGFQPDFLSRLWHGLSGDPEAEGAAAASTAMEPAVTQYAKDVASGEIARRGIPGVSPGLEGMTGEDIALSFTGGGLGTKVPPLWHGAAREWKPEPGAPLGRPRSDKMLTGEGYHGEGAGFYASEAREVGEWYRDSYGEYPPEAIEAAKANFREEHPKGTAAYTGERGPGKDGFHRFDGTQENYDAYFEKLGLDPPATKVWIDMLRNEGRDPKQGALYQLRAPGAEVEHFLEWHKPLREQSDYVKQRLKRLGIDENKPGPGYPDAYSGETRVNEVQGDITGEEIYRLLGEKYSNKPGSHPDMLALNDPNYNWQQASEIMQRLDRENESKAAVVLRLNGIRGTRYPAAEESPGASNYVFFNPETLEVMKKRGIVGLIGGGAAAAAATGEAQAEPQPDPNRMIQHQNYLRFKHPPSPERVVSQMFGPGGF